MSQRAPNVVSDYRINKFKAYYKVLDANNDLVISKEDFELVAKNMARLSQASPGEAKDMLQTMMIWWKMLSAEKGYDAKIPVSEAAENAAMHCRFTDSTETLEKNCASYQKMFDLIDRNKDGFISPEELMIYYKSHEVHDEDFTRNVFQRIDVNGDGLISREEFVEANCTFWLSDDPASGCDFLYDLPK